MKRLAVLISTLMILGLFAGCATGPGTNLDSNQQQEHCKNDR